MNIHETDYDKSEILKCLMGEGKHAIKNEDIITRHILNSMKARDRFLALL